MKPIKTKIAFCRREKNLLARMSDVNWGDLSYESNQLGVKWSRRQQFEQFFTLFVLANSWQRPFFQFLPRKNASKNFEQKFPFL